MKGGLERPFRGEGEGQVGSWLLWACFLPLKTWEVSAAEFWVNPEVELRNT